MMEVGDEDINKRFSKRKEKSDLLAGSFLQKFFVCLFEGVQEAFLNQSVRILTIS